MKFFVFSLTFILAMLLFPNNTFAADEDDYGYLVKLSWIGNETDLDLIMRNPKYADSDEDSCPLDCYYGQQNPDWGISGYELDDPNFAKTLDGITNIQIIGAHEFLDIGTFNTYKMIVKANEANTNNINYSFEIKKWRFEDVEVLHDRLISPGSKDTYMRESTYKDMNTRVIKFKQNKRTGKYLLKMTQNNLPSELPTNELVRVYLNEEAVFTDNGSHWVQSASGKKYTINEPWSMKVLLNSKSAIYVRDFANNIYKSANVNCNVLIGEYLGTNSFITNKKCKYKYKEHKILKID